MQKGECEYFINYHLQNDYNIDLEYNNANKWVPCSKIKLVKMNKHSHFTIIQQHEQIQYSIQSCHLSLVTNSYTVI